ncbi:MAG: 2,3-bisphosphoglycerate-independent phosphoglycerate mutase [Clostridia bacterium]|jgi:2,3-bisphosphoglycerate-independent phosphoglycerate mutase|nr:2,3-bisphosphoglycerate-independent phosphoglycerate mutase [Clostridia bacterium]
MKKTPLALIIMDGFGIRTQKKYNAVKLQGASNIFNYAKKYPYIKLTASGELVGLPAGQMGNSEVGHLNIGAGRIVYQDLLKISNSIESGEFYKNQILINCFNHVKKYNSNLHIMGLVSNGGIHSHIKHLYALLDFVKNQCIKNVYIHCFTDGRDTSPKSALETVQNLQDYLIKNNIGEIASLGGRYYAMDRENFFDRIDIGLKAINGNSKKVYNGAIDIIKDSYKQNITDEFIYPASICTKKGLIGINDNDGIIFFNFRADRAREITSVITGQEKSYEYKKNVYELKDNLFFTGFTQYDTSLKNINIAFKDENLKHTLGEVLADNNLTQLRIAETAKYAHVTYFFSGGRESKFIGEDRVLVPSPNVKTYDLKPEMSAYAVAEKTVSLINEGLYDVIILNFANCDMVGHSGILEPTIKAVEAVNNAVKLVVDTILKTGGTALITADHGNAEEMIDNNGNPHTAHTTNPVPFILVSKKFESKKFCNVNSPKLADIAPTILNLLTLKVPTEMNGNILHLE